MLEKGYILGSGFVGFVMKVVVNWHTISVFNLQAMLQSLSMKLEDISE